MYVLKEKDLRGYWSGSVHLEVSDEAYFFCLKKESKKSCYETLDIINENCLN